MGVRLKREPTTNGWLYFTKGVGNWGTDYLMRAVANALGPGWNRPQDAVYPLSQRDGNGDEYDGASHKYVIHFDKDQLPPAHGEPAPEPPAPASLGAQQSLETEQPTLSPPEPHQEE